jgi:hypothetical protein
VNNIFYAGTFSFTAGTNVVGMAIKNGFVWFRVNASGWVGTSATGADPVAGTNGIAINNGAMNFAAMVSKNLTVSVNTVAPFVHPAPTGFGTWGEVVPSPVPVPWDPVSGVSTSQGFLDNDNTRMVTLPVDGGPAYRSMTPADLTHGRYYLEFTVHDPGLGSGMGSDGTSALGPSNEMTGIGLTGGIVNLGSQGADDLVMFSDGTCWSSHTQVTSAPVAFAPGICNVGMAVGGGKWWMRINGGPWNGSTSADPVAGTGGIAVPSAKTKYFMATVGYWHPFGGPCWMSVNTAGPFVYTPPTGYRTWPNPPMLGDGFDPVETAGPPLSFSNNNQGFMVAPIVSSNVGYSYARSARFQTDGISAKPMAMKDRELSH